MATKNTATSAAELQRIAEEKRAQIAVKLSDFRTSIQPATLGNHMLGAASEATTEAGDAAVDVARRHPLAATAGAVSLGLLAAGLVWRKSAVSGDSSSTRASHRAASAPPAASPAKTPAGPLRDIVDIAPKLAVALGAGFLLERYLPRVEGEDEIWKDARAHLSNALGSAGRETIRSLASHPANPIPLVALATVVARAVAAR